VVAYSEAVRCKQFVALMHILRHIPKKSFMTTKNLITNTFYYGVIPKLTMLLSIVILPITTPMLTPFDYGILGIVNSYTSILCSIAPLGMNVHLTNSFYENPRHYNLNWGRILFIFLLSGLIFGLVNMAVLYYTLPIKSYNGILLSLVGSITIFAFGNSILAQHLFPLLGNPKPLVFTNLLASVIGMLTSFVMIVYFNLGYWGLVVAPALSTLLSFSFFIYPIWVKRKIVPIIEKSKRRLLNNLKVALPIIPHTFGFVLLTSSARIIMNLYDISVDEIGLYSHGCTIGDYILVLTNALILAITPQMQVTYRKAEFSSFRKIYFLCQGVALVTTFFFCIWMPELYGWLIRNEQLKQSSNIASMMCFSNIVLPFYVFASAAAFIQKKTTQLLWMVFVPGLLNVTFCIIFIPIFGYKSAIYSTMASYWTQLFIPFVVPYYKKTVGEWLQHKYYLLLIFIILFITVIVGNTVMYFPIWVKLIVSSFLGIFSVRVYMKCGFNRFL